MKQRASSGCLISLIYAVSSHVSEFLSVVWCAKYIAFKTLKRSNKCWLTLELYINLKSQASFRPQPQQNDLSVHRFYEKRMEESDIEPNSGSFPRLEHNLNSVWCGNVESTLDETQWIWWSYWYVLINHFSYAKTSQFIWEAAEYVIPARRKKIVPLGSPHWGRHWERPGKMTVLLKGIKIHQLWTKGVKNVSKPKQLMQTTGKIFFFFRYFCLPPGTLE